MANGITAGGRIGQKVRTSMPGTLEKPFELRVRREASATRAEVEGYRGLA